MAEELKNLIEKIQKEGVQKAEAKAMEIEDDAERRAEKIIKDATQNAKRMIEDAQADIKKQEASTQAALKQAGRDLILSLKKQINSLLQSIIRQEVGQALKPEAMASLITELIKNSSKKGEEGIVVTLNKTDAEKFKAGLLQQLKDKVKQGLEIRPSDDVRSGFRISFDAGKSHFDFSDTELADYISNYLKPSLRDILDVGSDTPQKKKS